VASQTLTGTPVQPSPSLLLAGLYAATTYTLTVVLTDPAGNAVTVSGLELTTPPAPDTRAPSISALAVGPVTDTTVRITWQTDEKASGPLRRGRKRRDPEKQGAWLGSGAVGAAWRAFE